MEDDDQVMTEEVCGVEGDSEPRSFVDFLYSILEMVGPLGGKYSKERVRIIVMPGCDYSEQLDPKYREELVELRDELNSILKGESSEHL